MHELSPCRYKNLCCNSPTKSYKYYLNIGQQKKRFQILEGLTVYLEREGLTAYLKWEGLTACLKWGLLTACLKWEELTA
jgi:hypothetical protein